MNNQDFSMIAALIGEPTRSRILWRLLDGKAYTASELASFADVSATSLSNHLTKLLKSDMVSVVTQGRHRYYSLANENVAYAVEALANLIPDKKLPRIDEKNKGTMTYCRSCYDHLAGHIGVGMTEAMVSKNYLKQTKSDYLVTDPGWEWLAQITITKDDFQKSRRPLTRQCLDWSERRPHLAGHLGAVLFSRTLEMDWFRKIEFSRALVVTAKGEQALRDLLGIHV